MATFKNLPNLYNLPSVAPQQAEEDQQGDMARGFKTAMMQIPQTAGGALALAGDALGADGLRDYGMGVYQKNSDKIAALSKDSDSLSNVIEGDASAADWLQYAAGYTGGQALTAVATGGLGGMIGSQLAKRGIREVVARGAQSAAAKQVAGKVAATGAKVGAGTALLGTNLMQEAGSIYPEAREEAQAQGRELDGGDLARVGLSAAGAAAVDTAMDAVMLGRMTKGGRRAGEGMARAAVREVPAAMGREAVTEGIQTGIERYGAGKELSTADAIREYVDSIGMGAVGGGLGGGASVLNTQKVQESGPLTRAANAGIDEQIRLEKERELMGRDPKTGKRIEPEPAEPPKAAPDQESADTNMKAWSRSHDAVPLDYAHGLLQTPAAKGLDLMIAPHASGKGYTVIPSNLLSVDDQVNAQALQKADASKLPGPDTELPGGNMVAGTDGVRPETYGDRQQADAERKKREELGITAQRISKAGQPAKAESAPAATVAPAPKAEPAALPAAESKVVGRYTKAEPAQALAEKYAAGDRSNDYTVREKPGDGFTWFHVIKTPKPVGSKVSIRGKTAVKSSPTDIQRIGDGDKERSVARDVEASNLQDLDKRKGSLLESQKPVLPQLRREGNKNSPRMGDELLEVHGGDRGETKPESHAGQGRQRRKLRAGQHGLGDKEGASKQSEEKRAVDSQRADKDVGAVGGGDWPSSEHTALSIVSGNDSGGNRNDASKVRPEKSNVATFADRADANAAMLKAAEDTGRVHEVVESEDGTFAVQPVAENKDTSSEAAPAAAAQGDQRGGEQARPDDQKDNQRGAQVAQKRDAYTQDLFGIQLPDVDRVDTGSARQPAAADTGDLDSADAVPKGAKFGSRTKLVTENKRKLGAIKVVSMDDAANALAYLSRGAVERLDALVTDKDGKPLAVVGAFKGALTQASVYPATIVGEAFRVKGAANIWFAHNHPSGNEELSNADRMLYKALQEVFSGSDIEPRGLFAIAGGTDATRAWQLTDGDDTYSGETSETGKTVEVPVVERHYMESSQLGPAMSSPSVAKTAATEIADGKSGVVLMDVRNRPIAFVPIDIAKPLRQDGRMDAIYRAVSMANAAQAIVVTNGSIDADGVRNLGALLRGVDTRVVDVMDTSGAKVESWAEQGMQMEAPTFFKQSVKTTANQFDQSLYDDISTGKSSKDILSRIAKESDNALSREIAQALLDAGINPKITQETADGKRFTVGNAPPGYAFAAAYSPKTDTVMLFRPEEAERNALHEFVHAGSFKALRKNGPASVGMKQLYKHVQQSGKAESMYGMSNFDEFTAEALSNPEFQDALRSITAMPEGSKFENVWQWFVDLVRRALGLPTKYSNALDQALRFGRGLMTENGRAAVQSDAVMGNVSITARADNMRKASDLAEKIKAIGRQYEPRIEQDKGGSVYLTVMRHSLTAKGIPAKNQKPAQMDFKVRFSDHGQYWGSTISLDPISGNTVEDALSLFEFAADPTKPPKIREYRRSSIDPRDKTQSVETVRFNENVWRNGGKDYWRGSGMVRVDDTLMGNVSRDTAQSLGDSIKNITVTDIPKKAGNRLKDFRGVGLQALGRRQILDIYGDDFKPEGKPSILGQYNQLAQQMDADKNEAGAQADGIADRWGKLKDERELAELMHDATLAQIDPEKDYQPGDNRAQWSGLRNRYNAMSADAKAIYKEARNAYTDHWMKVRAEIKNRIERSMPESPRRAKMLERMDDEFFQKIKGVYFPLARFGDYLVTVKGADGKTESVNFAETLNEAEKLRAELVKKFPKDQGHVVGKVQKRREFNAARDAVGRGFLQELFGLLDQSGVADELRDSINQLYLSSLPDLSWAKHGIHRKGTPGFSQDARRAFAQNMFHGARYLAKLKYADQMADKLTDMQDFVDSKVEDESFDSVAAQQVVDEMTKRHDAYMNPKTNPLSTTLTSLGFVFYLGLSPASAIVNLSQTPLVTLPMLAAKYGYGKASAALLAASKQAAGNKNDISKALAGDELRAFNEAVKSGVIDVSMAHDLAGIASGEDTKTHAKLRPVMKWASFLFHHGEKFNRQATMMAAYRLAREAGQDHDAAYASAVQVTYDSHFDYSAGNRPRMMQGDVARVVLLFKQYAQNMVYTLSRNAMLAANGDKESRKVISGLLLSHAMAAGVLGLPVVGTLLSIASALGSDDDEPWDAKVALRNALADAIGEKPAEVLVHGLSRLTPFDISGRVGLDKLILPDVQEGLEGARAAESWMSAMLGPIAGIGINTAKGLRHIAEGDYSRGMESILPSALRGPVKAIRYAGEGVKDKTGIVVMEDTSALEELGQALGFSPSRVREANEGKSAVYQADRRLLDRRQALMTQWAHARMAGDAEGAAEVQESIKRFNEKNPSRKITQVNLNQSMRQRQKRIDQAENGVYLPANRRDVQDVGRFASTD